MFFWGKRDKYSRSDDRLRRDGVVGELRNLLKTVDTESMRDRLGEYIGRLSNVGLSKSLASRDMYDAISKGIRKIMANSIESRARVDREWYYRSMNPLFESIDKRIQI